MLDQIFGQLLFKPVGRVCGSADFSGWPFRVGLAHGLGAPLEEIGRRQDSGTVKSAVLALLGLLLGFSFALAGARHEARRELVVEEANSIGHNCDAGLNCYLNHTVQTSPSCCESMFRFGSRRIVRGNFRINLQRCANAVLRFRTVYGLRRSLLPQSNHLRSPRLSLPA